MGWASLRSKRATVEVFGGKGREVDALKTTNVDCGHAVTVWICSFPKRMDAALCAELMLDFMFVERVGTEIFFWGEQAKVVFGNKPKKRSLPRADGAVAIHHLSKFALDFESDLATVTATFVGHYLVPFVRNITARNGTLQKLGRGDAQLMRLFDEGLLVGRGHGDHESVDVTHEVLLALKRSCK